MFQNVRLLIYIFDVESNDLAFSTEMYYYLECLRALYAGSGPGAEPNGGGGGGGGTGGGTGGDDRGSGTVSHGLGDGSGNAGGGGGPAIFVLVHKMDLVKSDTMRESVLAAKIDHIRRASVEAGWENIRFMGTSIYDESLYRVRLSASSSLADMIRLTLSFRRY